MGIVNVTPDSFSDGGKFHDPGLATEQCLRLDSEGADYIDLGAESTRPGSDPVSPEDEWSRLSPVLTRLSRLRLKAAISLDTRHRETMIRGADLGVKMINNVGPMADSNVLGRLAAHQGISYLAMHMHGTPKSMQAAPLSRHAALKGVARFFAASERTLLDSGFEQKNIWLDPGIGFGKTDSANLGLIGQLDSWAQQYNVAVGVSRKSMFDRIFGVKSVSERDGPSKVLECCMWQAGARLIRTHDVARLAKVRQILTSVE